MVNTQAFFTNIRETILQELSLSEKSILVAVAWFTDKHLFNGLIEALSRNVKVEVCIMDDEINTGSWSLPWPEFKAAGGKLFLKSEILMHNKFCVLDGKDVISGSYNWTKKAAQSNEENVVLTSGDYELASSFVNEFKRLTGQSNETLLTADIGKIIKRLQLIINLIDLEEKADIAKHATRLKAETDELIIKNITDLLLQGRYGEGTEAISSFIKNHSQITTYSDPAIAALRMEIRILEYEIVALESERTESENVLRHFNLMMQRILGDILNKILYIKKEHAYTRREESKYSESEYQEAKRRYEKQARERKEAETEDKLTYELDEAAKSNLKKMYKQAALLCHPDKVAEKDKNDANILFIKLKEAYIRRDINAVANIHEQLKRGWFSIETERINDIELLQKKKQEFIKKRASIVADIAAIKESEGWKLSHSDESLDEYFNKTKLQLEEELSKLENLYATK